MKKMKTTTEVIKISIILPCYNVAQYIERSINSILSQNFDGYEIIIVNDGSRIIC
ncbi:MAG: glycosyltransferase [Prevotella sp.]|nr:glycosyltransferase [Prevotella sp.]